MVADKVKHEIPEMVQSYVPQNETRQWPKSRVVVCLNEHFEGSQRQQQEPPHGDKWIDRVEESLGASSSEEMMMWQTGNIPLKEQADTRRETAWTHTQSIVTEGGIIVKCLEGR